MATFQPDRPTTDLGAATFVQQGVKDVGRESLANLLATAGKAAWEFKVAGDISQTQEQAAQAITDFTNQVSNANNEVLDAQSQFIAASEDVQWGASSYSPTADEVKALEDAKTNLARVKTARANNVITETEMRARVSDITRKGISLMPGRSREFIQASNEALGTHSGNIKLEADRQTVLLKTKQDSQTEIDKQTEFVYKEAIQAGISPVDSSGREKDKQRVIAEYSPLATDRQYIAQVTAQVQGNEVFQKQVLQDPRMLNKLSTSNLMDLNAAYKSLDTMVDPQTNQPLSIEQKIVQLQTFKAQMQSKFAGEYGGAQETAQYKNMVSMIDSQYALLEKNLMGGTSKDYSSNLVSTAANEITMTIQNNPVLREAMILKQVVGEGQLLEVLRRTGAVDFVYAISSAVRGLPLRATGSNTPEEQAQTFAVGSTIHAMVQELAGGEWGTADTDQVVQATTGYLSNWQADTAKNNKVLFTMLADPNFLPLSDRIPDEAKDNVGSALADVVFDTMMNHVGPRVNTNTMTITTSRSGTSITAKSNATKEDRATIQQLNNLTQQMQMAVKGLLHLQGSEQYASANKAIGDIMQSVAQSATVSNAEAAATLKEEKKIFWDWVWKDGTGTLEQYKAKLKAIEETVPSNKKPPLAVGIEYLGYRFKGGDAGDSSNWEKI
jgi:hypothetical protein